MNTAITLENIAAMKQKFTSQPISRIARNAATQNGVNSAARNPETLRSALHEFSIQLDQGNITNQKKSGRCWMFAALNCLRFPMIQQLKLDEFELSQSYTLFYDKLEKSNYFLENKMCIRDSAYPAECGRFHNNSRVLQAAPHAFPVPQFCRHAELKSDRHGVPRKFAVL